MERTTKVTKKEAKNKEQRVAYSFMMITILLMEFVLSLQGIEIVNKLMGVHRFNKSLEALQILLLIVLIIMIALTISMRKSIGSYYKRAKNILKKLITVIITFSIISILLFININNAVAIIRVLIGIILGNAVYLVFYLELLGE